MNDHLQGIFFSKYIIVDIKIFFEAAHSQRTELRLQVLQKRRRVVNFCRESVTSMELNLVNDIIDFFFDVLLFDILKFDCGLVFLF